MIDSCHIAHKVNEKIAFPHITSAASVIRYVRNISKHLVSPLALSGETFFNTKIFL